MPPPAVVLADLGDLLPFASLQGVYEGGLADARRPQQDDGLAVLEVGGELFEAGLLSCADGDNGHVRSDSLHLVDLRLNIGAEVRLVQHHDRFCAALLRHGEVPLQPPQVQVLVEGGDDERGLDVRHDHLLADRPAGIFPGDLASSRQYGLQGAGARIVSKDRHPVSDGGTKAVLAELA